MKHGGGAKPFINKKTTRYWYKVVLGINVMEYFKPGE